MMASLNERVVRKGFKALTTAVVLSYYRDLQQVYYCYAGHPPMLTRSGDGDYHELMTPRSEEAENLPFGVRDEVSYIMSDAPLGENDLLLIYSDGVLEAPNRDGGRFGIERLRATLAEMGNVDAMELKRGVIKRLRDWTGGSLDHDDVTVMAIQLDEHGGAHGA
ncbi:MAG: serine/threonine-protein phosphatase [Planctomycetes bacterium]|nr:serine/threonine-protein phosphatase [Planctomycetota bacterium]